MKIFIKTLKGTSFDVEVKPEDTVFDLKKKIETAKGWDVYPAAQQMLVYQGKILNDNNTTLQENNVSESSFVVIMLNKNNKKPSGPGNSEGSTSTANSTAPATTTMAPRTRPPADAAVKNLEEEILLIQQILDMGGGIWDRDTVVRALRASHNNPDTAVDFLYCGIPEAQQADQASPVARAAGRQSPQPTQPIPIPSPSSGPNANPLDLFPRRLPGNMGSASGAAASVGTSTSRLDFLRNIPQFHVLRAMVQAHPQLLEPMLHRLARQLNPQQTRLIQENQPEFLELFNESVQGNTVEGNNIGQQLGGGGAMPQPQPQPQEIRVTAEEHEAIERLVAMGFDRALVLEVYFACNKNEQLAANYLLDHLHDFDH